MSVLSDKVKAANDALQKNMSAALATKQFGQAVTDWVVATDPVTPPPPPASGLPKFGVATGYTILTRGSADRRFELDQIKAVGGSVVRFDSTPGNQAQVDPVVADCAARDMKVILALYGTTGPRSDSAFAGQQASKWKGNGTVVGMEICNEPDLNGWQPDGYAYFVKACGQAIHAADPSQKVIAGALFKGAGGPQAFTRSLIGRAKGSFDVLSLHLYDDAQERGAWNIWDMAYPWPGGAFNGNTCREILDAAGLQNVPIVSTESGAPTPKYSVARQAQIVANALAEAKKGKIACCCVYAMMDDDVAGFGMLASDRTKRPAWDAYKGAVA